MDETELRKDSRRIRAEERLGTRRPVCVVCGEHNPHCLEKHHVAGRKNDETVVILCRNCHRKQSDAQRDHPQLQDGSPSMEERIGLMLLGLAEFFLLLVEKLKEFAAYLLDAERAEA